MDREERETNQNLHCERAVAVVSVQGWHKMFVSMFSFSSQFSHSPATSFCILFFRLISFQSQDMHFVQIMYFSFL